jgi:hypothetical protein
MRVADADSEHAEAAFKHGGSTRRAQLQIIDRKCQAVRANCNVAVKIALLHNYVPSSTLAARSLISQYCAWEEHLLNDYAEVSGLSGTNGEHGIGGSARPKESLENILSMSMPMY